MKKIILLTVVLFSVLSYAQVGINTNTPDSSSALDIESTTGGILIPRLTETQRDAISSPATGLMIYQTDQTTGFYFYDGIAWTRIEGVVGPQGETGPAGPQGPAGPTGLSGADGTNGTNGSSAYEIWIAAGNTGTEAEFLATLVGVQGEPGAQGPQGEQGEQGPAGPQGPQGVAGTNGIDGLNGATGPQGSQGEQGEQGPQGPQGETGAAGTNGTNGSDGADGKGISSTVDNGDGTFTITYTDNTTFTTSDFTGPQGPQGETGAAGATGPQGPAGPAGPQGDIGAAGASGNGIASSANNGDGTFTLTFDDGTTFTTDDLTGPAGSSSTPSETGGTLPVGSIISYAGIIIPDGWLVCDGSEVSRADYSSLFNVLSNSWGNGDGISTFNLPDLRGRFLRGVDIGSGNDPDSTTRTALHDGGNSGDNIGSYQTDEIKQHNHTYVRNVNGSSGGHKGGRAMWGNESDIQPTSNQGGSETRPKNAYVYFIIKAGE